MALVRVNEHGRCVGRFSSRDLRKLRLGAGFIALKRVTERRAAAFSTAGLAWAAPHVAIKKMDEVDALAVTVQRLFA